MKRITFALCFTFISLCTMAQGTHQKRLQGNPKIDSLISEVKALGIETLGGTPRVTYYFDGKFHKKVDITCQLMNDYQPTPPTGNPQKDAQNHLVDSVRKERSDRSNRIYDAIRNTCKALTDEATESYTWEYHRNGVDSVRYTIALGEYQGGDTLKTWQHNREVQYHGAPEIITFRYDPLKNNNGGPWMPTGFGYFSYEFTPDSVGIKREDRVSFNKQAYTALIQPIMKQKGITTRQFYIYCDSTYTPKDMKWKDDDDFAIYEKSLDPLQPKSENRGTVYTMQSKELADSVLSQLIQATWEFLNENSNLVFFHFHPHNTYGVTGINTLFQSEDYHRVLNFYRIYLHSDGDKEFNIVVVEGTGDMMIPMEWLIMKSWKNGKIVYDKKRMKNITRQQARENTARNRFKTTRQYTPID
ncbi:hypothetical protein SAMN06298211_11626 [Prevotellaceae bacterium MN60]|nr:hypothetical protein SAMN06298211_11626 [Prevotellaceae bacterium MN60]